MGNRAAGPSVTVDVCDDPQKCCASPGCRRRAELVVKLANGVARRGDGFWCAEHWPVLRGWFIRRRVAIGYGPGAAERIVARGGAGGTSC
jgi:hypothetical protein